MTIKYLDSKRVSALSSDTKPTNVETNSILIEKDTANRFWYDGSAWVSDGFQPTDISGLKLWLDANVGITKDGGDLVSQWDDQSGEGNHLTQATGTNQPLWVDSAHNSLDTIRFDGVDNKMSRSSWTGGALTQPSTIFIVCTINTGAGSDAIYDGDQTANRHLLQIVGSASYQIGAGSFPSFGTPNSAFAQFNTLYNTTASHFRRNKSDIATSQDVGTNTLDGIRLGANDTGTNFALVDISEMLIYNADVSDTDRDLIEDYLATKWGL